MQDTFYSRPNTYGIQWYPDMSDREGWTQLDVDSVSPRARETARTLLEAYYLQDERETYLVDGRPEAATEAGAKALDRMATTYEREFPDRETSQARAAGEAFMRALFLQDEIENWNRIREVTDSVADALVSSTDRSYEREIADDRRWATVETHLQTVCEHTGVDERYARRQTEFWLCHGQDGEDWERFARDAHELKARAIVGDAPPDVLATLGTYFVEGVKCHDRWSHENRRQEVADVCDLVSQYYEKLFQLRDADR